MCLPACIQLPPSSTVSLQRESRKHRLPQCHPNAFSLSLSFLQPLYPSKVRENARGDLHGKTMRKNLLLCFHRFLSIPSRLSMKLKGINCERKSPVFHLTFVAFSRVFSRNGRGRRKAVINHGGVGGGGGGRNNRSPPPPPPPSLSSSSHSLTFAFPVT